jgi:hypothetical protein
MASPDFTDIEKRKDNRNRNSSAPKDFWTIHRL